MPWQGQHLPQVAWRSVPARTRRGLAPPREIYDVRDRDRVAQSTLPEGARPSDPDLFEGCAHEG
jgi:hypothetical protein